MEQKSSPKGSFQEDILRILRENPDRGFTFSEIAQEFGRTLGSTSGTLSVLYKNGYIRKTNDHPAKYIYNNLENKLELDPSNVKSNDARISKDIFTEQDLQQNLHLRESLKQLKEKMAELDQQRENLRIAIETLEKILRE